VTDDASYRGSYGRFIESLKKRLAGELPGVPAQLEMAPLTRRRAPELAIDGKECAEAAVLALFYPDGKRPAAARLLLTVRPREMTRHAGQVAFPGGRREDGETLAEAALRETEEEVSIPRGDIVLLGRLTPLFIPPSGFCVHPFVGALHQYPDLAITSDEVDDIFGVGAAELGILSNRQTMAVEIRGALVEVPCFKLDGRSVWGATAMMLSELASVLADLE
jgi:8-oxo-dGTP pyrophosphatase MutT (NUDIX family)